MFEKIALLIVVTLLSAVEAIFTGTVVELAPRDLADVSSWPRLDKLRNLLPVGETSEIHTWTHWIDYGNGVYKLRLDLSAFDSNLFTATILFDKDVLERAHVNRIDGELTKSFIILSTNTDKHVVQYLKTDYTCVERVYRKTNTGFTKTETACALPNTILDLPVSKIRKNFWMYQDRAFANWGTKKKGYRGGAVVSLPSQSGVTPPSVFGGKVLHVWKNDVPGYSLTLLRVVENNVPQFYAELRYNDLLLDSGVKLTRFDDDMLTSIYVPPAMRKGQPVRESQDFRVMYKMKDGSCWDRTYNPETTGSVGVNRTDKKCHNFTVKVLMKQFVTSIDSINGWRY